MFRFHIALPILHKSYFTFPFIFNKNLSCKTSRHSHNFIHPILVLPPLSVQNHHYHLMHFQNNKILPQFLYHHSISPQTSHFLSSSYMFYKQNLPPMLIYLHFLISHTQHIMCCDLFSTQST